MGGGVERVLEGRGAVISINKTRRKRSQNQKGKKNIPDLKKTKENSDPRLLVKKGHWGGGGSKVLH